MKECDYCRNEQGFTTIDSRTCRIMGKYWGKSGWTTNCGRWTHRARIIKTYDGKYRILLYNELTPPINYCPKCGRKLNGDNNGKL